MKIKLTPICHSVVALLFLYYLIGCTNDKTVYENDSLVDEQTKTIKSLHEELRITDAQLQVQKKKADSLSDNNKQLINILGNCFQELSQADSILSKKSLTQLEKEKVQQLIDDLQKKMSDNGLNYKGTIERSTREEAEWIDKYNLSESEKEKIRHSRDSSLTMNAKKDKQIIMLSDTIISRNEAIKSIGKKRNDLITQNAQIGDSLDKEKNKAHALEDIQGKIPDISIDLNGEPVDRDGKKIFPKKEKYSRKKINAVHLKLDVTKLPHFKNYENIYVMYTFQAEKDPMNKHENINGRIVLKGDSDSITYTFKRTYTGSGNPDEIIVDSLSGKPPGTHLFQVFFNNCNKNKPVELKLITY